MNLNPYLTPYTKTSLKWIKDLKVRVKTPKPEENVGVSLHDLGLGNVFLGTISKHKRQKKT